MLLSSRSLVLGSALVGLGVLAAACSSKRRHGTDAPPVNSVPPDLTAEDALAQLRAEIDRVGGVRTAVRGAVLGLGADAITQLSWNPSHDSAYFRSIELGAHVPVLVSNDCDDPPSERVTLAMVGTNEPFRYATLASNPLSDLARTPPAAGSPEEQMIRFDERLVRYLLDEPAATLAGQTVVLAHLPDSYYYRHDEGTPLFFQRSFPEAIVSAEDSCEGAALAGCLETASLLVLGGATPAGDDDLDGDGTNPPAFDEAAFDAAMEVVERRGIPVLFVQYGRTDSELSAKLMERFGLTTVNNYWTTERITAGNPSADAPPDDLAAIAALVDTLIDGGFTTADFASCVADDAPSFASCDQAEYESKLRDGLDTIRAAFRAYDARNADPFAPGGSRIVQLFAWLGDIYRAGQGSAPALDYPVDLTNPTAIAHALLADHTICLSCTGLRAQADLGTYVCPRDAMLDGSCTTYDPTTIRRRDRNFEAPFQAPDVWTSTGAYAVPGVPFTVTRTDSVDGPLAIRIGFQRTNSSRTLQGTGATSNYDRPQYITSVDVVLEKGRTVRLTSPYGGPIYLVLEGDAARAGQLAKVAFEDVGAHAALLDVGNAAQVSSFVDDVRENPLPHVDLRATGFEMHLRKDRFLSTAEGQGEVATTHDGDDVVQPYDGNVGLLVADHRDHFVGTIYQLAGFARPGSTLDATLSDDVKAICANLGMHCLDATVHARDGIQHANYDQYAQCGAGCSGNPFDASWSIDPFGWGDSHELGHNLQIQQLNLAYVPAGSEDLWTSYSSRAGENSNNIFPYFVKYRYLRRVLGDTRRFDDGHMDQSESFSVIQSGLANLVRSVSGSNARVAFDRSCAIAGSTPTTVTDPQSEAMLLDPGYAADNGLRMAFYLQIPLHLEGKAMSDGTVLRDGFEIFTLLYQLAREYAVADGNATTWNAERDRLGFGTFPYDGHAVYAGRTVSGIPGNDFMLVALSYLSGRDFRPYFANFGLRTSSLAKAQVAAHVTSGRVTGAIPSTFFVLEDDFPPASLATTPTVALDGNATWPRDGFDVRSCP